MSQYEGRNRSRDEDSDDDFASWTHDGDRDIGDRADIHGDYYPARNNRRDAGRHRPDAGRREPLDSGRFPDRRGRHH